MLEPGAEYVMVPGSSFCAIDGTVNRKEAVLERERSLAFLGNAWSEKRLVGGGEAGDLGAEAKEDSPLVPCFEGKEAQFGGCPSI